MTTIEVGRLSATDARALTEQVKDDAAALWAKLLELYEGKAHIVLGYSSWGAYYKAEFGESGRHGYRLLKAAEVVGELPSDPRVTERIARELVPLTNEPEELRDAWREARTLHGVPTAAEVRDVVRSRGQLANQRGGTDEWETPQDLFDLLDREFHFDLDVCALPTSAKCERYFTPEDDGLSRAWDGICWMNPPYGEEIGRWVRKAWEEARKPGATVVCLVPARVDTGWWWDYCRHGDVRFLRGRLKFGAAKMSAPFPSAVVVFHGDSPAAVEWWER
jgi:phage N-6-adenine-methyltransferase